MSEPRPSHPIFDLPMLQAPTIEGRGVQRAEVFIVVQEGEDAPEWLEAGIVPAPTRGERVRGIARAVFDMAVVLTLCGGAGWLIWRLMQH